MSLTVDLKKMSVNVTIPLAVVMESATALELDPKRKENIQKLTLNMGIKLQLHLSPGMDFQMRLQDLLHTFLIVPCIRNLLPGFKI